MNSRKGVPMRYTDDDLRSSLTPERKGASSVNSGLPRGRHPEAKPTLNTSSVPSGNALSMLRLLRRKVGGFIAAAFTW